MICYLPPSWQLKDKTNSSSNEYQMYINPIVQENIKKLEALGYIFMEPDSGMLAQVMKDQENCQVLVQ